MIEISSLPHYWDKNNLTVGILDTKPYKTITTKRYHELVEKGMDIWNRTLLQNSQIHSEYSHLNNVKFSMTNDYSNADVQIYWWFSCHDNGLTQTTCNNNHVAALSRILIGKNQGPDVPSMPPNGSVLKPVPVFRNEDRILSIVIHELGHVLGLGHCNFYKDLMKTGDQNQPDPKRRISNLNLDIITKLFSLKINDRVNHTDQQFTMDESKWKSVQS